MAAAEYFNQNVSMAHGAPSAPAPVPVPQQQPPPQLQPGGGVRPPNQSQANLNLPYPVSDHPPPYSEHQRPHSQPPPGQRPTVHFNQSDYQPYRPNQPNQPNVDTHQYPPDKVPQQPRPPPPPQGMYRQSDYPPPQPPPFQGQPTGYPTPVAPGLSQVYPNGQWQQQRPSSAGGGPSGYQRPSRSRSRSRERRKKHQHKPRPDQQRPKDGQMNTFLGAGGGAIIGDLIFPGLGTLGGAIIGGVGGHEYTKNKTSHRSSSNPTSGSYRRSYSNSTEYYADDYKRGRY